EATIFFFDKRLAEKLHKAKRKEIIIETLKRGFKQLEKYQHPKLLEIIHPLVETSESMAFGTEPIFGSLANIFGYLQDRLRQDIPSSLREYSFLEFEVKYGLLQLSEALLYLHYSSNMMHRNICPQSVIINKKGTWKLTGLEFSEKCAESDFMSPVMCQPFTSKIPKILQPDLDYAAPETQLSSLCSPQSDMFSLGLLICSLYNNGRSPLESNLSTGQYAKQLDVIDYFSDPGVNAIQYMDSISIKDASHKTNFFNSLKDVLATIPKATILLFENIQVFARKTSKDDFKADILPIVLKAFDSTSPMIQQYSLIKLNNSEISFAQCAALQGVRKVYEIFEDPGVCKMVIEKAKTIIDEECDLQVQENVVQSIELMLDSMEKPQVVDDVLPILSKVKLIDSDIVMPVARVYKHMLSEKKFGLNVHLLATKVMPSLIPVAVSSSISLDEFTFIAELLQEMLDQITKNQRNKMNTEITGPKFE
ncbi:SCY1-like protein 2, partial [Dinothrombium tinctorium]